MMSLRRQLLSTLGTIIVVIWLVVTVATVLATRQEVGRLLDARLAAVAHALSTATDEAEAAAGSELKGAANPGLVSLVYQVWSPSGRLLSASPDAPVTPLSGPTPGYGEAHVEGHGWRLLTASLQEGDVIHVAVRSADRDELMLAALGRALMPVFLALLFILAGLWFGIRTCLHPLARLSAEIATRDANNLEPLQVRRVPQEIRPLVAEVNSMLGRLEEAFGRFDRFAADAAHELRAPVTAIRNQAEAGLAVATEDERRHALKQILKVSKNCSELVEQVLLLARLEGDWNVMMDSELELEALSRDVMSDVAPKALVKGLDLSFRGHGPVYVRGNEELMRVLIRNLLDNAIRCTPAGGSVKLDISGDANGIHMFVEDTGPGIPAKKRSQVLQRFCRLPAAVGEGYGIGLSIVERIAEVHKGRVLLEDGSSGRGLKVGVCFRA
ncbi:MAG: ATP-binding protein [Gammaproteobacteria bacterium]|nr:ATP-binding protein [Gammaproteobacteria bacterium]